MPVLRTLAVVVSFYFSATAAQAACTVPDNANAFATEVIQIVNTVRAKHGLDRLNHNRRLSRAASIHACDMQLNGFFAHNGSDGSTAYDRITRTGKRVCRATENMVFGYPTPQIVVQQWMDSPSHRRNLLDANVREFGIGLAFAPGGPFAVMVHSRDC